MTTSHRRITLVAGTRPELIKLAPVLLSLKARPAFDVRLIVTAQHREMLDEVSATFGLTPDVDLDLMEPDQTPASLLPRVLRAVQGALVADRPDAVLVHGDTTTCFASALAAFYEGVPVGHVEAGLRTYDFTAPWPEEMNRRLVDPISRWCFAPTDGAAANLRAERISDDRIFVTGNTVVDALLHVLPGVRRARPAIPDVPPTVIDRHRIVLVTGHRRESFGQPLRDLCGALRELVLRFDDIVVVYPVHLNPNVLGPVHECLDHVPRVFLTRPLDYRTFVSALDRATLVITDSGGVQEEAPTLGTPVLVTRRATERPEAVDRGLAVLVGTSPERLIAEASRLLETSSKRQAMPAADNPYGDGTAAVRIADILERDVIG